MGRGRSKGRGAWREEVRERGDQTEWEKWGGERSRMIPASGSDAKKMGWYCHED